MVSLHGIVATATLRIIDAESGNIISYIAYQVPMYASLVELFPGSPQELQRLNVKSVTFI